MFFSVLAVFLVLASGCVSSDSKKHVPSTRPGPQEPYRVEQFRVGWYDTLSHTDTPERLAAAGFDSVMPYAGSSSGEEARAYLEAARKAGVGVHLDIPRSLVSDRNLAALEGYVRAARGSPALLSWYLYDEPEWKLKIGPRTLASAYERVKALDPERDIDLVFMFPRLSGAYRRAMDRYWIDWYPVAQRSREFAAFRLGRYADRMKAFGRRADRYGLSLTIVVQGFGEDEDGKPQFWRRLPTPAEARYMFYAALLSRPEEVVYWTLYRTRDEWFLGVLVPIVREFRGMFPDSVEYLPDPGFSTVGGQADLVLLGDGRGALRLLALSREGKRRTLKILAPSGFEIEEESGRGRPEESIDLEPYGVRLLKARKTDG